MADRVRDRAKEMAVTSMALADASGIKRTAMSNYWSGKRAYPVEALPRLAERLDTNVDWLLTGRASSTAALVDAGDADWVTLPQYNLRDVGEASLGDAQLSVPVRRDWLNTTFRTDSNLWLTRLLSDYPAAGLTEDQLVVCRTIRREELIDRQVCLWRVGDAVVIGRYSANLDAAQAASPGGMAAFIDPSLGVASNELLVPPSRSGPDGPYHVIGRILGVMLRPI